jgi:hypothetical protein
MLTQSFIVRQLCVQSTRSRTPPDPGRWQPPCDFRGASTGSLAYLRALFNILISNFLLVRLGPAGRRLVQGITELIFSLFFRRPFEVISCDFEFSQMQSPISYMIYNFFLLP